MQKYVWRSLPVIGLAFGALALSRLIEDRKVARAEAVARRSRVTDLPRFQRVRPAGRDAMTVPPRHWDGVDERADASFPASDPPGTY